jgi:hypothetical protein
MDCAEPWKGKRVILSVTCGGVSGADAANLQLCFAFIVETELVSLDRHVANRLSELITHTATKSVTHLVTPLGYKRFQSKV